MPFAILSGTLPLQTSLLLERGDNALRLTLFNTKYLCEFCSRQMRILPYGFYCILLRRIKFYYITYYVIMMVYYDICTVTTSV